jgi:aminoglycoside 6'-N-acetyltransferase I
MREALWPGVSRDETEKLATEVFGGSEDWAVFVCEHDGRLCGFAEAHLRNYVDGCETSPVGYVEGWYVDPAQRGAGVGRALVGASEEWARARGCSEMGSDVLIENEVSQRAHLALGYEEVERQVIYKKALR